jgi:hypothetical protein
MAKLMYEESELFGSKRMDRPNRQATMCGEAREALRSLPPNDTQDFAEQIDKTLKQLGGKRTFGLPRNPDSPGCQPYP